MQVIIDTTVLSDHGKGFLDCRAEYAVYACLNISIIINIDMFMYVV